MVSIEGKLDAIHEGLKEVDQYMKYLDLDILRALGRGVVQRSKQRYRMLFTKPARKNSPGYDNKKHMYDGIYSYQNKRRKQQVVTNQATDEKTGVRYPWVHAAGARIEPKKAKVLRFQIDGKWVSSHGVTLPVRDWVERPGNQYMASEQADDDIEKVIERKIAQLKKKGILA
jgi:hypothetical protein